MNESEELTLISGLTEVELPVKGGLFTPGSRYDENNLTTGVYYDILYVGGDPLHDIEDSDLRSKATICSDNTEFVIEDDDGDYYYMNVCCDIESSEGRLYIHPHQALEAGIL